MGESREKYPEIVLTEEERTREELLKRLGQSFQKLMEAQGNACALKGGTARAHSRFPGHALTPTGVMAIRCKQFHLPDL